MKKIPTTYNKDGFNHELLEREGNVAIYEQRKSTHSSGYYEVVVIRKRKADNDFAGTKAGDEYLPCTNEWGIYGWTYLTLEKAREKMSKIILEKEKKTW
jgi:hypothetical protein